MVVFFITYNGLAKRLYLYGVLACVVLSFAPIFKINVNKCLQIK